MRHWRPIPPLDPLNFPIHNPHHHNWNYSQVLINPEHTFSHYLPVQQALRQIDKLESREGATVYRFKNAVVFKTDMDIDIDGHPAVYHPNPRLAKVKFNWHAIAKTKTGALCPPNSDRNSPYYGFYPSGTSLYDHRYWLRNRCDPRAYVHPDIYPYFVLPYPYYKHQKWGPVRIGDLGVVINTKNGKMAYAIFADVFPGKFIGEGSTALARELGINPNPTTGGEESKSIIYIVFPGSGRGQGVIPSLEEIRQKGEAHFRAFGGMEQVRAIQNQLR